MSLNLFLDDDGDDDIGDDELVESPSSDEGYILLELGNKCYKLHYLQQQNGQLETNIM